MKTIRRCAIVALFALFALLATATLPASRAEANDFSSFSDISTYYLQQRAWVAPMVPPLLPSVLDSIESMILKGDYSFQGLQGWYIGWSDNSHTVGGDLSAYEGQVLIIYEDLASASIRIVKPDGSLVATFATESFPNLAALDFEAYEKALIAELNRRSISISFDFTPPVAPLTSASAASLSAYGGGYAMMSMGGTAELEVIDFEWTTNSEMAVTFGWPVDFTNRLDIYSCDASNYNGLGSWSLADIAYSTDGTNELRWLDLGQLGRGVPPDTGFRLYTAGKGADTDSDGDGYSDAYEHLVLNSNPNDGDTDGDGVSDGPFDPDGDDPIIAGPDPDPLDSSVTADTDGDSIGDNVDTDDDNDGLADGNDPQPLIPRVVAVYKSVSVETNKPSGDDNGTELFDVSSAGRMLDYAQGSDAAGGFGVLQGGIYFNYDASNLYVGVAGYESSSNNALMLLLDTDNTNGGAASLSGISGTPYGFGNANNLSFVATNFTPNIGILLGHRYGDGQNYPNFSFGANNIGQGVFLLTPTTVSDFPGFSSASAGSPISQWGDRGNDSANAGMEIAIALTNASLVGGDTFKAAAIVMSSESSGNRYFSKEAYGASVSGTLDGYGQFGFNAVTLVGAEVYLGSTVAPAYSDAPDFDEDDVILQGYYWDVPRPAKTDYSSMTVAGNFNGWNAGLNNMSLIGDQTWEYIHSFSNPTSGVAFKFAANGSWGDNWGHNGQSDYILPMIGQTGHYYGSDIAISGTLSGAIRFRFNAGTTNYSVEAVSTSTVTKFLPGYSADYWYSYMRQLAESNNLSRFTWVWMPPPQKSASGVNSVGYDPFDYYDIGTYHEKFTVETRYGSEAQLKGCVDALRTRGISPIVDLVFNHNAGGYSTEGGSGDYNFAYGNHDTFEKIDPAGNNSNGYYNANTTDEPFHYQTSFGPDVNVRHPYQRLGLENWGSWVTAKVGYQGYRWDIPINIDPWFVSEFMNSGLMKGKPGVMEFWEKEAQGTVGEAETFLALTDYRAALFDMPLRAQLEDLCEVPGNEYDISLLATAGLVYRFPQWSVPFAESHDTIRPYGQGSPPKTGINKDKDLAYAFVLVSEGTPMVAISDYLYGASVNLDTNSTGWSTNSMKSELDHLIDIRKAYAGGTTSYLSTQNTNDLFVMKRNGNESKPGCILVINDNDTNTLYDAGVATGWVSTDLVDVLDTNEVVSTDASGLPSPGLSAPPRGYRIYIRLGDL